MINTKEEILLIDKPSGITSYDVIRRLKKSYPKGTKIGHAGTLDPRATGLMIIGVGSGTKKLNDYLKLPKTYEAEVLFGLKTDSGDLEGKIIEEKSVNEINKAELEITISKMIGKIKLAVPIYSAIKIAGKPLYEYARNGEDIKPPEKEMEITSAKLLGLACDAGKCRASIFFDVASGTYIRSLAEELGARLHLPATLSALRRTSIGDFQIANAAKI